MARGLYIGDAATGAGYRLAGLGFIEYGTQDLDALIEALDSDIALVLLDARAAASLPAGRLDELLRRERPLFTLVNGLEAEPADALLAPFRARLGLGDAT